MEAQETYWKALSRRQGRDVSFCLHGITLLSSLMGLCIWFTLRQIVSCLDFWER